MTYECIDSNCFRKAQHIEIENDFLVSHRLNNLQSLKAAAIYLKNSLDCLGALKELTLTNTGILDFVRLMNAAPNLLFLSLFNAELMCCEID